MPSTWTTLACTSQPGSAVAAFHCGSSRPATSPSKASNSASRAVVAAPGRGGSRGGVWHAVPGTSPSTPTTVSPLPLRSGGGLHPIQEAPLRGSRWSKPLAVALGLTLVGLRVAMTTTHPRATPPKVPPTPPPAAARATSWAARSPTPVASTTARSTRRPSTACQEAADEIGFEPSVLESQSDADFEPNIQAHIDADCDLIVTVGFLLGDATAAAAEANPDQQFAIVDFDFFDVDAGEDVTFDNVRELTFATDEAAFLAGYVAAAVSETGVIGTYGGINIPTVTIFMDGLPPASSSTTRTRVRTSSSSAGTAPRRACSPATSRTSTTAGTPPSSCSTRTPTSSCRWPVPSARARSRRSEPVAAPRR